MGWKTSDLVIPEMLGLFVNTLAADDKYSVHSGENLPQPIQMKLSKKSKNFSEFFSTYLKYASNFEHFQEKREQHSLCDSQIIDCSKHGY